ncbi:MAG: hypothetical protein FWG13_05265 [Leptospirales bacterium]|nr:hypothetical protein [Leptospirales bacterium]
MTKLIAVIFDFDDTLAPDSTNGFLKSRGVDTAEFWRTVGERIASGWDPVPAYLYEMILVSNSGSAGPFTKELFAAWGRELPLYNGVTSIFERLRKHTSQLASDIRLEFYCVSSGIGDIIRASKIARQFTNIWSCDFHYDADGRIVFPRNIISFTDKTRYIFQVSKGFTGEDFNADPFIANSKITGGYRIPFERMIFVGDGMTDVPCFSLVMKYGGIALGVYDRNKEAKWSRAWDFIETGRVVNIGSADYGKKSDLSNSLFMAVNAIAERK